MRPLPGALLGAAAASLLALGCGEKKTDTAPTTPAPVSGGAVDWTISGTLVANPDAQPIGGASITVTGGSPVTSNCGRAVLDQRRRHPAGRRRDQHLRLGISPARHLDSGGANRSGLVIDLIRDSAPFSLSFYRELVRGSLDGAVRTTRRWHQDPSFYIQTIDENGAEVPQFFIDSATSLIADIVSRRHCRQVPRRPNRERHQHAAARPRDHPDMVPRRVDRCCRNRIGRRRESLHGAGLAGDVPAA
jgi:hypothetical protein